MLFQSNCLSFLKGRKHLSKSLGDSREQVRWAGKKWSHMFGEAAVDHDWIIRIVSGPG